MEKRKGACVKETLRIVIRRFGRARHRTAQGSQHDANQNQREHEQPVLCPRKIEGQHSSLLPPSALVRSMVEQATYRMPPVHPPVVLFVVQRLAMLLPKLVGKQKRDDDKRHDEKRAQNQMLDHDVLQIDEAATISL